MNVKKENKMGAMPVNKLVINVTVPLIISMLVQSLYNIVDGIFISRLGENALAAISLSSPIQMLMVSIAVGTGVGINSLLARKLGEKKHDEVESVANNGLFISFATSMLFVLFGLFLVNPFFNSSTDVEEVIAFGTQYLRICTIANIGIFFAIAGERFLQASGKSTLSMIAQMSGAIINIILDPILIFGFLGIPGFGIKGAAWATVIGQVSTAVIAFTLNKYKNKQVKINLKNFKINPIVIKLIYKVGAPMIIVTGFRSVVRVVMNNILAGFSISTVAMFGVYFLLLRFVSFPAMGLAQGLIPIIGYNYGAKNGKRIIEASRFSLMCALAMMTVGFLIFFLLPTQLLGLYNATPQMLEVGIPAFKIMSITFIPMAFTFIIGSFFNGMGNGMVNMIATALRQILLLPIAYLFARWFGEQNIWYAFWLAEGMAMIFVVYRYLKSYKKILSITPEADLKENA